MKEKHSLGFIPNKFKYMENCIFCKIIAGAIPCYKVYEDDDVLVFFRYYSGKLRAHPSYS